MSAAQTLHHEWKIAAREHFQRWSEHYDRDIINTLLFDPCYRRVLAQLRHWQRRGIRPRRILDVGCGTGTLLVRCFQQDGTIAWAVGLDMSEHMVAHAQVKTRSRKLSRRLCFTVGDAEHLPFPPGCFDLVTCCNSFHHYPHQQRALEEMRRVLVEGGWLILIDGSRDDPIGYFIFEICVARVENHVHHCAREQFRALLRAAGFGRITQQVIGICPPALVNIAQAV